MDMPERDPVIDPGISIISHNRNRKHRLPVCSAYLFEVSGVQLSTAPLIWAIVAAHRSGHDSLSGTRYARAQWKQCKQRRDKTAHTNHKRAFGSACYLSPASPPKFRAALTLSAASCAASLTNDTTSMKTPATMPSAICVFFWTVKPSLVRRARVARLGLCSKQDCWINCNKNCTHEKETKE